MSQLTEDLDRLIQKAALDGVLTQKAVDMFHSVLKENDDFKTQLETDVDKIKADALMIDSLKTDLRISHGLNKVAAEMEASLINREQKITVLEMQAKYELARVEDHKEMFKVVFRNSVLRKEVMTPASSHTEATGASHSTFSAKDTVEEEEM